MLQLDLKSFGIGILLTSSFIFGVAATNEIGEMIWDEEQKWLAKRIKLDSNPSASLIDDQREQVVGWQFVGIEGQYLIYRRPVDDWPELPEQEARYQRGSQLKEIYP
jgi:hypothetical protein